MANEHLTKSENQSAKLERLLEVLEQAKIPYQSSNEALDEAFEEFKKSGGENDGPLLRAAARRDNLRQNYYRAIRNFNEYMCRCIGPTIATYSY